jgi:UDP-3-O-[3-hydroxymyristoyl] glucosamine N-acyltransferase
VIGVPLAPRPIEALSERHGGELRNGARGIARRLMPIARAGSGDLAPFLNARYHEEATAAALRGALLLIDEALAQRSEVAALPGWFHPHAVWAMAELLDLADAPADAPVVGEGCKIGQGVILMPRVRIGARVTIAPGAVIGAPGFGFATGKGGAVRDIPQLGGVIIEDDVHIGALSTIAAGTIGPTILRRGVKLDAQVHVGHNCDIGEGTMIAAQSGLAGSVMIGKNVLLGGQVGIADHLTIGDGARIAAKSGVIGDVAPGSTIAGYPAVERHRWLRGLAELYRLAAGRTSGAAETSESLRVNAPGGSTPSPPSAKNPETFE